MVYNPILSCQFQQDQKKNIKGSRMNNHGDKISRGKTKKKKSTRYAQNVMQKSWSEQKKRKRISRKKRKGRKGTELFSKDPLPKP